MMSAIQWRNSRATANENVESCFIPNGGSLFLFSLLSTFIASLLTSNTLEIILKLAVKVEIFVVFEKFPHR